MSPARRLLALALLPVLLLLSGCGPLYAERREVEQLRVMEVLGLDAASGGVLLSLSGPALDGEEQSAFFADAVGASLADALARLQERSAEETIFCGHLQHLLVGEEAARAGLEPLLTAVCRSSDLRPDLPLYLILGGSAKDALSQVGGAGIDIADALQAAETGREHQRLSSARGILLDLDRQGCALVRALRLQEQDSGAGERVQRLAPAGYGVLVDGQLRELIGPEEALGAELLVDGLRPCALALSSPDGRSATLELEESRLQLVPAWDGDDELTALELRVWVRAVVQELDSSRPLSEDRLSALLEAEIAGRVGAVLQRARDLEADFLGLGRRIERLAPLRGRGLDRDLGPLLPGLTLRISVQGELSHSNDLKQGGGDGST